MKKFKEKKKLKLKESRSFIIIDAFEDWRPTKKNKPKLRSRVLKLNESQFEDLAIDLLHYPIATFFLWKIDIALKARVTQYLHEIKQDILRLRAGALGVDANRVSNALKAKMPIFLKLLSSLWTGANTISFYGFNYRATFEIVAKYSGLNYSGSIDLRNEIKKEFYTSVDTLEPLFVFRYGSKASEKFEDFIVRNVLSDLDLSNFLRGGKSSSIGMAYKDFRSTKTRFQKNQK